MSMYWVEDDWTPTADNINELPKPLRSYIHALHTECDPAGNVQQNVLMKDMLLQANSMIERLKEQQSAEIDRLRGVLADTIRSTEANRLCISIYTQNPSPDTYLSLDESDRVVLRQLDTARAALSTKEAKDE